MKFLPIIKHTQLLEQYIRIFVFIISRLEMDETTIYVHSSGKGPLMVF